VIYYCQLPKIEDNEYTDYDKDYNKDINDEDYDDDITEMISKYFLRGFDDITYLMSLY
jgi:hypothetical protein